MLKHIVTELFSRPLLGRKLRKLALRAESAFEAGRIEEAILTYREALQIAPGLADTHNNLGIILQFAGDAAAAGLAFEQAIKIEPSHGKAHYNLALLSLDLQQPERAEAHLSIARDCLGDSAGIVAGRARLASFAGDVEAAAGHFSAAWQADPNFREAADSYLLALAACGHTSPARLAAEHRRVGMAFAGHGVSLSFSERNCDPDRPLTIGYLSPDFREHSVRYFFEPLIAHHDRQRFRIICYNDTARRDAYTESVRKRADVWRECAGQPDDRLAGLIVADQPDILVELAGHTAGNRMSALARRLAPVQISGLGYPPTTGVPNIDYKLSDPVADPPDAEKYYSEKLIRLPATFWCYSPPSDCPPPAPAPCLATGHVTFGCFGNIGKISAATLNAWQQILAAVPGSRLLVKSTGLGNAWSDEKFRHRLTLAGIALDRVLLQGPSSGRDYQLAYAEVDLILDTFPFNGGTTTAHALWMSVPVLTLAGELLLSRMGASMLSACGHPELITDSWNDYVKQAIAFARNPQHLASLRVSLRDEMKRSPLCDGPAYVAGLERAYRTVWQDWGAQYNRRAASEAR